MYLINPSSFQIYEKICDLTGESKYAERIVKKPISFKGTSYVELNKTIVFEFSLFINIFLNVAIYFCRRS